MPRRATMVVANPFTHDSRVLKEAMTLLERGWRVTVVASAERALARHETRDGIDVVRVPREPVPALAIKAALRARAARSSPPGGRASPDTMPAAGVAGPELHARRALEATMHARFWRRAALAAMRLPADLVVAHDLDGLPAGAAAARRRGVPLVYDSHELWVEMPPVLPRSPASKRRWMAMEARLARRAGLVIVVSDAIADELVRRYGIRRPLVIRNVPVRGGAAPRPTGELRARMGIDAATPLVLYIGGLQRGRGLEELLAAAARVPEAALAMVGPADPVYGAELRAAGHAHGLDGRLHLLGPAAPGDLPAIAAEADVGVIPYRNLSLNHYFALPTKLFEYLGAGLPVVGGDLLELRKVIRDRGVGLTCDTDDPAALADAIRRVLGDREAFRANASRAGEELTWEREGARYADALEALVARDAPNVPQSPP